MLKRLTRLGLTALALLTALAVVPAASAAAPQGDGKLCFPRSGKLKVAVFSDVQTNQNVPRDLLDDLTAVLDLEKPDLVVYLGDQVEGKHPYIHLGDSEAHVKSVIDQVLAPVVERGIPFTAVFGNHDAQDAGVSKEVQLAYYQTFPGCLMADDDPSLPGCGNHHLLYYSPDGSRPVLDLFFLDSLEYDGGGYGCVSKEQINWQRTVSSTLEQANGAPVPTVNFQHIIVPEVYNTFTQVRDKHEEGAFAGKGIGKGNWYTAPAGMEGLEEAPCPPNYSNGQFAAWRESGNVKAAFFGHDHLNSFTARLDGIDLAACPGATYTSYNNDACRGVRILEFTEEGIAQGRYDTRILRAADLGADRSAVRQWFSRPHLWGLELPAAVLVLIVLNALFWPVFLKARKKKKAKAAGAEEPKAEEASQAEDTPKEEAPAAKALPFRRKKRKRVEKEAAESVK